MKMFTIGLAVLSAVLIAGLAALAAWRVADHRADARHRAALIALQPADPMPFDPAIVAMLPDPARRYFLYTIAPGTPLWTVAELDMTGQFGRGTRAEPNYMDMTARQVIAPPQGFIWKMQARRGLTRMSGSDTERWTRFWVAGLAPVARYGGSTDHARSAFGRYIAEAVFWAPAALLPGPGITWQAVDDETARVTVRHGDLVQVVDVTLAANGEPRRVEFQRWSDENPDRQHRLQPFGGILSDYRDFGGFRLPTRIEAGNNVGTDEYFAFFVARVTDIRFPGPGTATQNRADQAAAAN